MNDTDCAMTIRPRRSVLYMPGANARAMEKARTLPCDAVILDLEDAVAPGAKETARAQVMAAVAAGGVARGAGGRVFFNPRHAALGPYPVASPPPPPAH